VAAREEKVKSLTAQLADNNQTIHALTSELAGIQQSRGWRVVLLARKLRDRFKLRRA
jgi:hypothetical protein